MGQSLIFLDRNFRFESKKALTAAAANWKSLLFVDKFTKEPKMTKYQAEINLNNQI